MNDATNDVPVDAGLSCSARGCQDAARFSVVWNNPRLHTPDRRKIWLACDEHRDSLAAFLSARGFLRGIEPLTGADPENTQNPENAEDVPGGARVSER